ncbi:MAG: YjbH domain-containing protein [Kiloniellales bacterium]|nr:YjbH domain-containing protein [Kiloniellales bacterium]
MLSNAEYLEYTPSISDFGTTGLIQMPNARFHPEGELHLGVSHVDPYTRGFFTLQIFDWLEGTFRYTDVSNRRYSNSREFSGSQSYKDRSVDLKILMLEETKHFPQIAVGLRDIGGTDLFGSEFLVASRRYYNWDFTLGVAWGNAGSRGHVSNPFGLISDSAKERGDNSGAGGLGFDFFRGEEIAFFGGIEYLAPVDGLRFKLEYDSNSYQDEPLGNEFDVALPLNFAVEYEVFPWWRLSAGLERGNQFMVRTSLSANLMTDKGLPKFDRPAPKVEPRQVDVVGMDGPVAAQQAMLTMPEAVDRTLTVERLFKDFEKLGVTVSDIEYEDADAILRVPVEAPRPSASALATAALQVIRAELNGPVERVRIVATREDEDYWEIVLDKDELLRSVSLTGSPIALVEPPDPTWLGLFPEPEPTTAAFFEDAEPADPKEQLRRVAEQVFAELERQGFEGERFDMQGSRATVHFSQDRYRNPARAVGRGARAVAAHVPRHIEEISVVLTELGVPVSQITIMRRDLENALQDKGSTEEIWQNAVVEAPSLEGGEQGIENEDSFPRFTWSLMPRMRQQIGGPDNFFFFQFYGRASAQVQLSQGLTVSGAVAKDIYNNYDDLKLKSDSRLHRVRSDIARYLRESDVWIDDLHLDYITKLAPEVYGRASVGIFELMFAGVGGEVLYRPQGKRWAVGVDVNYVKQRDFDGLFGLQNYDVVTGHVSYYHRLPWYEILATVRAGRYLAKDWGATLELSRTFNNGVTFGVFATKTDVSADKFGEGKFDKGFFVSIPLDLFFTRHSRRYSGLTYRPVTRDGGQRLDIPKQLYGFTEPSSDREVLRGWKELLE